MRFCYTLENFHLPFLLVRRYIAGFWLQLFDGAYFAGYLKTNYLVTDKGQKPRHRALQQIWMLWWELSNFHGFVSATWATSHNGQAGVNTRQGSHRRTWINLCHVWSVCVAKCGLCGISSTSSEIRESQKICVLLLGGLISVRQTYWCPSKDYFSSPYGCKAVKLDGSLSCACSLCVANIMSRISCSTNENI